MHRLNGCCVSCDAEVFECEQRFPKDHVRAGEMGRCGPPLETAVQAFFLLTDGSHAQVTLCDDCLEPDLKIVWAKCMGAAGRENELRDPNSQRPDNMIESQLRLANEAPLGIIGARPFREVLDDARNRV